MQHPGGFSDYLSRFLTQFFGNPLRAALIAAALLMIVQRQVLSLAFKLGGKKSTYIPLTFIPSILFLQLLCDENFMLSGVVSLVMALAAAQLCLFLRRRQFRMAYILLMIPVVYMFAGGTVLVFTLLSLANELISGDVKGKVRVFFILGCGVLLILSPLIAKWIYVQYPLSKLWTGGDFYRFQSIFPGGLGLLWALTAAIPVLFRFLPSSSHKLRKTFAGMSVQIILLVVLTLYGLMQTTDWKKEEVMRYDYFAQHRQWDEIIRLADRRSPSSPLSVSLLNLALSKQGLLPDRMFHYYQNRSEGLMPSFMRDFTVPFVSGEVYYHLGFINTAQRYAFEAMESIPDHQKSVRAIKRLAETNLLNGEYEVAAKYLRLLQKTLYYKVWADETLLCLSDEKRIEANPEWANLRKYRTKKDFLFSETEKDMMLGIVLQQDPTNRPVYEYLMAYCLLTKDLEKFYRYYPIGRVTYQTIPKSYQEALVYIWGLSNPDISNCPFPISNEVKKQVQEYKRIYTGYSNPEQLLRPYSNTYWYYLHFRQ
jgi:hypothetical protein